MMRRPAGRCEGTPAGCYRAFTRAPAGHSYGCTRGVVESLLPLAAPLQSHVSGDCRSVPRANPSEPEAPAMTPRSWVRLATRTSRGPHYPHGRVHLRGRGRGPRDGPEQQGYHGSGQKRLRGGRNAPREQPGQPARQRQSVRRLRRRRHLHHRQASGREPGRHDRRRRVRERRVHQSARRYPWQHSHSRRPRPDHRRRRREHHAAPEPHGSVARRVRHFDLRAGPRQHGPRQCRHARGEGRHRPRGL